MACVGNRKLSGFVKKRESLRHPSFVRIGEMPIDFADQHATIAMPEPARNSHEVQALDNTLRNEEAPKVMKTGPRQPCRDPDQFE